MNQYRPSSYGGLPPVVKNLLIINSIMALLGVVVFRVYGVQIADWLALHYPQSHLFRPWQLFTYMFLHGDPGDIQGTILHLVFNMFALWMFGSVLEPLWGSKRFLIFYLVCGIGAGLCHLGVLWYEFSKLQGVVDPAMLYGFTLPNGQHIEGLFDQATVGASGAVFGILFAFGYLFPNTLLYFYFLVPIKAKWVIAGYIIFELYAGIRNSAGDVVAHFAHLGGVLFAFILIKIWGRHFRNRLY